MRILSVVCMHECRCTNRCVFDISLCPCLQLAPTFPLPHPLQLYEWLRLPRVLCGWTGFLSPEPQDIFYAGKMRRVKDVDTLFALASYISVLQSCHFPCLHSSDSGRGLSVSLPASLTSYQVTGLRLGRRYRFSVQPSFDTGLGTETSVDEHTGNTPTDAYS